MLDHYRNKLSAYLILHWERMVWSLVVHLRRSKRSLRQVWIDESVVRPLLDPRTVTSDPRHMKMKMQRHDDSGGNDVIYSYDIFVHLYDISVCYISMIYDIFI